LWCALHAKFIADDTVSATAVLYKSLFHRNFFNFLQSAQKFATTIKRARQQLDLIVRLHCIVSRGVRVHVYLSDTAVFLPVL